MSPADDAARRADERQAWNSVAAAWQRWWPVFEDGAQPLNDALVAGAGIAPGHRVLDVASGIGEPALTAARAAGPDGRVLATDFAPEMLALARRRAADAGVANVAFSAQDGELLAVAPRSVDAAVCRWGLMLMVDPVATARCIARALRPGARLAAAVWAEPEAVPFLALPGAILRAELDLPAPEPDAPGPFRLAAPDALPGVLDAAGLRVVERTEVEVVLSFAEPMQFVRFVRDLSSAARRVLDPQPADVQARVEARLAAAVRAHAAGDGPVVLHNRVRVVVAAAAG